MEFSVDYSLNSWNWNRRYYLISRTFVCFWLLMTYTSGITAKQINAAKLPMKPPVYPKPSYSFSKSSGLSIVQPAALLNGKQFVVEPVTTRNVTTQVGQTTYLHCIVDKLEDKTVSWLRLKDFHLLTVGLYTYTSDTRFQTIYNEYATDWTLQIRYPQLSDEGLYECQVSSDPPISHYVYLKVIVPKTKILGSGNFYVSVGSEINLTCVITDCPEPPAYVFWYHDSRMINFDPGRINIALQKAGNNTAISRLRIRNAEASDSGNYSCSPSNADVASIFVHVLKASSLKYCYEPVMLLPSIVGSIGGLRAWRQTWRPFGDLATNLVPFSPK
ncbi:zwei Ig domain protein zig-8-like isoform X3 [Argiope bruennichi]|uniref:zwei Ig domain protein zig-8-like isoform X3 n=1 Tax=Argiope bruennichi TaxID=94029 RepID=UPI0024954B50|nr:zwei Ig domain protein zig-8-like isoform X3 [Argiope bruennichi]